MIPRVGTIVVLFGLLIVCSGCANERTINGPPPPPPPSKPRGMDAFPAWSPDGHRIAFHTSRYDSSFTEIEGAINVIDLESREISQIRRDDDFILFNMSWGPDGRWLLMSTSIGIARMLATGDSLTWLKYGEYHVSASWSRVSNRIFFGVNVGPERGIYSIMPDGSNLQHWTFPDPNLAVYAPDVFPNSDTLVVYAHKRDGSACLLLYFPGDTSITTVLQCGFGYLNHPRASSDHRSIIFLSNISNPVEEYVYLFDRVTGEKTQLTPATTAAGGPDVSPDGRWVVFTDVKGTRGLKMVNIRTRQIEELTPGH